MAMKFLALCVMALIAMSNTVNSQFSFFSPDDSVEEDVETTNEIAAFCTQPPPTSVEELAENQILLEQQVQQYFFDFLPCAFGGSDNIDCCLNVDRLLGPYPDAPLHNCLCLPGAFQAAVDASEGVGNENTTAIYLGCSAREDISFRVNYLDLCFNNNVTIPEGYDPEEILAALDLDLPPTEDLQSALDQLNEVIAIFSPPDPTDG